MAGFIKDFYEGLYSGQVVREEVGECYEDILENKLAKEDEEFLKEEVSRGGDREGMECYGKK